MPYGMLTASDCKIMKVFSFKKEVRVGKAGMNAS
jgi:hypothetical protein